MFQKYGFVYILNPYFLVGNNENQTTHNLFILMKKINQLLKHNLKEINDTYENGYTQSVYLKRLKKDRERWKSRNIMQHQLYPFYKPHALDAEIKKMDKDIDKAIMM